MSTTTEDEDRARAHARQDATEARERAVGERERAVQTRERSSEPRESAALVREDAVHLREQLVRAREDAAEAKAKRQATVDDMRDANEKLTLLSIRSHELAEDAERARSQMEASERDLQHGINFRERLIGIVSHDLRNPLGAITMALGLLGRKQPLNADGKRLTERIRRSTERMGSVISQLLDFTRAHAIAGIPLTRTPIDLAVLCRHVVEELEMQHELPGRFQCQFDGDLTGTWDGDRLAQVISNLGGNAIEHGAVESPIQITGRDQGDEILLEVHNGGTQIPAALLPFIFDPFRGSRQQTQSYGGGLGLGLYISEQIVRGHGGTIEVRSTAGDGTTFSIRLPRQAPAGEDANRA